MAVGRVEQRMPCARSILTSSEISTGPCQLREIVPQRLTRSIAPVALTRAAARRRPPARPPSVAQDPLDLAALAAAASERRLKLDDLERLDEQRLPGARGVGTSRRRLAARWP